jgi:hypothetical protein
MMKNASGWTRRISLAAIAPAVLVAVAVCGSRGARAATPAGQSASANDASETPYVVEYYYKAKWGHAEEFLTLFKKNHYPVLMREKEMGRILRVSVAQPRLHGTEDGRWDYRVTIVFKSAAIGNDNFDSEALTRQMFPDQETYKKEEQRRFEILEAHWDLPIKDVNVEKK